MKRIGNGTVTRERRIDLGLTERITRSFLSTFFFGIVFGAGEYRKCSARDSTTRFVCPSVGRSVCQTLLFLLGILSHF